MNSKCTVATVCESVKATCLLIDNAQIEFKFPVIIQVAT